MNAPRRFCWSAASGLATVVVLSTGPGIAPGLAPVALAAGFVMYFAVDAGIRRTDQAERKECSMKLRMRAQVRRLIGWLLVGDGRRFVVALCVMQAAFWFTLPLVGVSMLGFGLSLGVGIGVPTGAIGAVGAYCLCGGFRRPGADVGHADRSPFDDTEMREFQTARGEDHAVTRLGRRLR